MNYAYAAYAKVHTERLDGRSVEAEALLKGASLLKDASANPGDIGRLAKALDYNLKLWTVLEADLYSPASTVPEGVRDNLLALSRYMTREISRATRQPDATAFGAMIAVNRNVANGLL